MFRYLYYNMYSGAGNNFVKVIIKMLVKAGNFKKIRKRWSRHLTLLNWVSLAKINFSIKYKTKGII